jgi:hypothetical protein
MTLGVRESGTGCSRPVVASAVALNLALDPLAEPLKRDSHFCLFGFDELAIVRRIEVKKRPARFKEGPADSIGCSGREYWHCQSGYENSEEWHEPEGAGDTEATGRRDGRSDRACYQCLARGGNAAVLWPCTAVNGGRLRDRSSAVRFGQAEQTQPPVRERIPMKTGTPRPGSFSFAGDQHEGRRSRPML